MPINSFLYPGPTNSNPFIGVSNSLRFNIGSTDSLTRTLGTATNGKKFTISVWAKLASGSNAQDIMAGGTDGSNETFLRYNSNDTISFRHDHASDTNWHVKTNRVLRDPSAWFHIVAAFDSTQSTDSNRAKIYINGVQETSLATSNYPAQNEETFLNVNAAVSIGKTNYTTGGEFGGYMCEFVFVDSQALDPTTFGEFDSDSPNIWKPKAIAIAPFGTNGFYLQFKQTGTSANSSGIGADTSGNDSHFTVNNLTAVDQSIDTCTNNFATLNTLSAQTTSSQAFTDGNLTVTSSAGSGNLRQYNSTIAAATGKWYCEVKVVEVGGDAPGLGIIDPSKFVYNSHIAGSNSGYCYLYGGNKQYNGSGASYGDSWTTNDIIGIAMDLTNSKLYFSKNGTFQNSGDPTSGSTGTGSAYDIVSGVFYTFGGSNHDASTDPVYSWNFGSPSFTISSGNSDANGYGNFEYSVPSGYFSLCNKNLAEFGG